MRHICLLIMVTLLFLQACEENKKPKSYSGKADDEVAIEVDQKNESYLSVELIDKKGKKIGKAVLDEDDWGVIISIEAENLSPGSHGFHIHEYGLCETPTFETAGGHFNPNEKSHGFEHENGPHAGDLPNLIVGDNGTVKSKYINDRVTLQHGKAHSLRGSNGSSLIIHSDKDDNISQPAGNAGERIACGVISAKSIN